MPDKKLPTLPKRKIKRPVIDDIEDHLLSQHQDKGPPLFVLSSGKGVHRRFDSHDNMMTNTMKDLKLEKKYPGLGNMLSGHKKGPMRLTRDPSFSSNQLYGFQFFSKPTDAQRKYLKDFIIDKRLKSEDYQLHMPDSDENALRLFRRSIDNLGESTPKKPKAAKPPAAVKPPRPKRDRIQELEDEMERMTEKTGTRGAAFLLSNGRRVRNTKYNTHGEFLQDALKNLKYPTRNRTDNREWNMLVKKKRAPNQ